MCSAHWINGSIPATCTKAGWEGEVCNMCGKPNTNKGAELPVDPNAHDYGSWQNNDNGTHTRTCTYSSEHTENGDCFYVDGKCTGCGALQEICSHTCKDNGISCDVCGREINIEHTPRITWAGDAINHWYECTVCGEKQDEEEHTYGDPTYVYIPGKANMGTLNAVHVCTICDYEKSEQIGTNVTVHKLDPTCIEYGKTRYIKKIIGETTVLAEVTDMTRPPLGHQQNTTWSTSPFFPGEHAKVCNRRLSSGSTCKEVLAHGKHVYDPDYDGNIQAPEWIPTCTEVGYITEICTICKLSPGSNKPVTLDPLGHAWNASNEWTNLGGTAGHKHNCTREGCEGEISQHRFENWISKDGVPHILFSTCEDCGHETSTYTGDHQWDDGAVTTPATCKPGVKTYTCTMDGCGVTKTEDIPATGIHVGGEPVVTPATCEARGTKITSCKDCGTVLVTEVILPLGHSYTSEVTKEAACTEKGVRTYTCQRAGCEASYTEDLPMVPHTLTNVAEVPAACETTGMKAHSKCGVCGKFFTGSGTTLKETSVEALTIPSAGHDYVDVVTAPTCTEGGYTTHTCTKCGDSYTDNQTNAVGHAYGAWTITAAPTMSAPGAARRICANDVSHVETAELPQLPAPGTPDSVWTLDAERSTAPTCTESGENVYVSVYGEASVNVPALDHSFPAAWTYDGANHWHACTRCGAAGGAAAHAYDGGVVTLAPTAYTAGVRTYTCTACGRYYTEAIPATGTAGPVSPVFPAPDPGTSGGGGAANPSAPTETILDEDTPLAGITFDDVMPTDPFYEAVRYVFNRKLMNGVSDTSFDPYGTLTRAMVVTILYRLDGEPAAEPSAFLDVAAGQWYTDAVGWGAANKVVKGYSEDRFGPMDPVTREQLAAILHRYAQYKGYDVTEITDLAAYADMASISEYALEAMAWAVTLGAPEALSETALAPRDNATRAQVAVAFMNFCEKYIPLETEGEAA